MILGIFLYPNSMSERRFDAIPFQPLFLLLFHKVCLDLIQFRIQDGTFAAHISFDFVRLVLQ